MSATFLGRGADVVRSLKCHPLFLICTMIGSFLAFSAYFDSGPEAFFELDFCHSLMRRDRGAEKNRARGSYSWWGKMPVIVFVIVPPWGELPCFKNSRNVEMTKPQKFCYWRK